MTVIKEYKELSEFKSDDLTKTATIIRELGTKRFIVRMKSDSGSYFTASCDNEEKAEEVADDWVRS
jgi:hypothetical protein